MSGPRTARLAARGGASRVVLDPDVLYNLCVHQSLDPQRTTWHITFGTCGTRLHGDLRPAVDLDHNNRGGWTYRIWAAGEDHVYVLLDIIPEVHGEKVR